MTVLALIGGALLFLLAGVVRSIVSDEAKGWGGDLGLSLVRRAVQQLPPDFQADKQLEWEGEFLDLASTKPISALMWSWRLFRSRHSTAHEMRVGESSARSFADSEPITLRPPDEIPPYLRSLVDGFHAYGWQRIAAAMQDATLAHVDERINLATARFFAVIDEARAVSNAPLPRFGPPPGSYAWNDVYDPAPPELRPNFKIYSSLRQEVIPPPERWPIRWLRSFLALGYVWWIVGISLTIGISFLLLLSATPLWVVALGYGVGLNFEMASRLRRIAMFLSWGLFLGYVFLLFPFVVEHGLVEFEVARVFGLTLLGFAALCVLAPIELIGKWYRRFSRRRRSQSR